MRALFMAVALLSSTLAFADEPGPIDVSKPAEPGAAKPPTDKQLDDAKAEVKWHKDQAKQIDKAVGAWEKDVDAKKFDKAAEVDADLKPLMRDQLGYLRDMGFVAAGDDLPAAGAPMMVGPEDKMDVLGAALIEVRTQTIEYAKPEGPQIQARRANLDMINKAAQSRYDRKEKQYDEMKEAAKG